MTRKIKYLTPLLFCYSIFAVSCNFGKPDVCDCNTVYQEEYPDIKIVEKIVQEKAKYITGNPVERARRECRLKWANELKEYGGYSASSAEAFFQEKCK